MSNKKKKVFFHYEARGDTYSKSLNLRPGESSVEEVIALFSKAYREDHQEEGDRHQLGVVKITDSSGNTFKNDDDLYELLNSKDDCYVLNKKPKTVTLSEKNSEDLKEELSKLPQAVSCTSISSEGTVNSSDFNHTQLMSKVDELFSQKALRKARDICLEIISNSDYRNNTRALEHLCHIAFQCKKYDDAIKYGEQALSAFEEARRELSSPADHAPLVLSFLNILLNVARSQSALGESEEALERIMQGLKLMRCYVKKSGSSNLKNATLDDVPAHVFTSPCSNPIFVQGIVLNSPTIIDVNPPSSKSYGSQNQLVAQHKALINLELEFKADLTSCLFHLGRNEEAGSVVNALIGHPSSVSHVLSLLVYAEVAAACNKIPEAVQGALKAIVLDSTHRRSKTLVSKLLGSDAGLQEVYKQVPPVPQAAAAYAFLANVVKDMSHLDTAETLLRQVIRLDPNKDATHFLALAHLLEGKFDLKGALNTIILAISSQQRRAEYDESEGGTGKSFYPGKSVNLWCKEWNEILTPEYKCIASLKNNNKSAASSKTMPIHVDVNMNNLYVQFHKKDANAPNAAVLLNSGKATNGTQQVDGDFALVLPFAPPGVQSGEGQDMNQDDQITGPPKSLEEYDSNQLDILALAFTAIKLLFLLGRLGSLPRLIRHVESIRRASKIPLHETNIRNEHAYYLCIVQIMSYYTTPTSEDTSAIASEDAQFKDQYSPFSHQRIYNSLAAGAKDEATPIYVCGDSHVLSSAYAVISPTPNSKRVLLPKLVTGVKQWHLRKESDFYTKEIFRRAMVSVPDGSEVIFCVGEIDCREGILVAVEKGVYKDVQEGMNATILVFRQVIQYLVQRKKLKVYLHPIIPVLDVTRGVVQMFNTLYKAAMKGVKGIHWLDIESNFVKNNSSSIAVPGDGGYMLRDEYKLDGTHIHPRYVSLLEAGLRAAGGKGDKKKR